jgi:hypothetical protein
MRTRGETLSQEYKEALWKIADYLDATDVHLIYQQEWNAKTKT